MIKAIFAQIWTYAKAFVAYLSRKARQHIEVLIAIAGAYFAYDQLRLGVLGSSVGVVSEMLASQASRTTGVEMIPAVQAQARTWWAPHDEISRNLGRLFLQRASEGMLVEVDLKNLRLERNVYDPSASMTFGPLRIYSSRLDGATLENHHLMRLEMHDVSLDDASFIRIAFDSAALTAVHGERVSFVDSHFHGATISSANLPHCRFSPGVMVRFFVSGSTLIGCSFQNTHIREAQFEQQLDSVSFVNAELSDVDFRGASLKRANFSRTQMRRVNFDGADLTDAIFEGATFDSVSFVNANLTGTKLEEVLHRTTWVAGCMSSGADRSFRATGDRPVKC